MTTLKEALDQLAKGHELDNEQKKLIIDKWQKELGIQPCEDAISRQAVMETICTKHCTTYPYCKSKYGCAEMSDIKALPSVQPKYNTDEWCHDCSEYDHDKHCCPRYNKVIRNAVEEIKQPKTGHWKKMVSVYDMIEGKYRMIPYTRKDEELSNPPFYVCDCGHNSNKPTNYCPDCGAKMIKPQESEDKE